MINNRKEKIYRLRQEGKTYTFIASQYNISSTRVRDLFNQAKFEKETLPVLPPLMQKLSIRSQNCLRKYFGGNEIFYNPTRIVELGRTEIRRLKNIGKKSINEISKVLYELGHIKNIEDW
jgi:DNA-directed RNA polymerase alpha subunit